MLDPFYNSIVAAAYDALTAAEYDAMGSTPPPSTQSVERAAIFLPGADQADLVVPGVERGQVK